MAGSTPASSFSTGGLTLGPRRSMAALEDGCEKAGSLCPLRYPNPLPTLVILSRHKPARESRAHVRC